MATAGYSGTPLLQKLGIKPITKLLLVNAPANYMDLVAADISSQLVAGRQVPDLVHIFAESIGAFDKYMTKMLPLAKKNTAITIWVSWYKKSAPLFKDLTEEVIRNYALQNGLVDVKVCAVSEIWSGLKLVVPKALR